VDRAEDVTLAEALAGASPTGWGEGRG